MRRLLYDDLLKWKDSEDRKPLILKGVRQCGKTYLLQEFGKQNYTDLAYFNFEGNKPLQERFENDLDVERIIAELGILRRKAIKPGETLIIFDEVQFCNNALTSLKYFCENLPQYHIACAGSLLGLALSGPLSFPVGKVNLLTLRPMNFYEFLLANGEKMLCDYLTQLPPTKRVSELFADKLENYLRCYYITGGMPEVVAKWIKTKDIVAAEEIQQRIIDSYELDFAKHAPAKDFPKLTMIRHSIPEQLARENSKFIFSHVKKGLRAKDLEDALEWLLNAGLVYKVAKIEKPAMPLSAYADRTFFKLYLADIGLLRKMSKLPAKALFEETPAYREFKGALVENYVLCELVKIHGDPPFYWKSANRAEVDFVSQFEMDIVPIEVKSERNKRAKSLAFYRKAYNPRIAIKATMDNVSGTDVKNVPLYLFWKLHEYLT